METVGMVLDRIEAKQDNLLELPPDAISLDLLRAVYRNPSLALPVRLRAAIAALPHEVPKLMATAIIDEKDWATLLDRRIRHFEEMKLIEAKPSNSEANGDAALPPRIPDRRFRRI